MSHPDYVKEVLVTRQHSFEKGLGMAWAKFLFGEGLLTSEGAHHTRPRRLIQRGRPGAEPRRVAAERYSAMSVPLRSRFRYAV